MTTSPSSFRQPEVVTQVSGFLREKSDAFWRTVVMYLSENQY